MQSDTLDSILDVQQVADRIGVKTETVHGYHKKGLMPPADHYIGRSPVWKQETIQAWTDSRPRVSKRRP